MAVAVKEVSPEATGAVVSGETLMKHFHSCVQEFDDHFQKSRLGESHLRFREIMALLHNSKAGQQSLRRRFRSVDLLSYRHT